MLHQSVLICPCLLQGERVQCRCAHHLATLSDHQYSRDGHIVLFEKPLANQDKNNSYDEKYMVELCS